MAQILEFTVEGLAGRSKPYSAKLNSDVNVFFGLNGSGKTTLLKILHSALSADTDILSQLPFTRAEVKLFLNRWGRTFTRSIKQIEHKPTSETASAPASQGVFWGGSDAFPHRLAGSKLIFGDPAADILRSLRWTSDPPEPDDAGLTTYRDGFLSITRLYRNVSTSSGARRLSDQELDAAFARELQNRWSQYYADISKEITKAQERGFANILGFFLEERPPVDSDAGAPDESEAYRRTVSFLSRQAGFGHLVKDEPEFARLYANRAELRHVVKQIQRVERDIDRIGAPRERFRSVLEAMFTGDKHLKFTEKEIRIELSTNQQIGLTLLSSGEKQLLFIALHALTGSNHALIIDEPELSMHIDWQKRLISTLRDLNPDIQLVMATHSPEIMADLSDDKVFRL